MIIKSLKFLYLQIKEDTKMNKKQKSGIILASLACIAAAGSIMAGATYALFTSESTTNIAVTSGKVNVTAEIKDLKTFSGKANSLTGDVTVDEVNIEENAGTTFVNGGTATIDGTNLKLAKMTPGDKVTFNISITNNSTVAAKYRTVVTKGDDTGLFTGLEISIGDEDIVSKKTVSLYKALGSDVIKVPVVVNLPSDRGNEYQDKECDISFTVEAIQGNASDNVIEVNPSNAQETIDNLKGDATIVLTEGNYGSLYLRQDLDTSIRRTDLDVDTSSYPAYYREIKNLTIKAKDGANVICDQFKVEAGLFWYASAPASNQSAMDRESSGFISYLSLENIVLDGIKFTDITKIAVHLRDNASNCDKGSTLYVDNFVVKNCEGTGDSTNNSKIHFIYMGTGATDEDFDSTGKKGLNNIYLINNTMTNYYQPICCNNSAAVLTNLTVKNNKFANPLNNAIQLSNKVNDGEFVFDGNILENMNGRFVRLAAGSATLTVTIRNTTVTTPVSYDTDDVGQIFKVTGTSGFKVNCSEKSWSVITNTETTWVANGDMSLLPTT